MKVLWRIILYAILWSIGKERNDGSFQRVFVADGGYFGLGGDTDHQVNFF